MGNDLGSTLSGIFYGVIGALFAMCLDQSDFLLYQDFFALGFAGLCLAWENELWSRATHVDPKSSELGRASPLDGRSCPPAILSRRK